MATRILIVEDSPTQVEALRELLADAGYAVEVATSGEDALRLFDRDPVDVVLSDIVMPGAVDGYELCRRIKAGGRKETPVILLTGLADPMDIIRGLECGADNFLTKPYDPDHLLERLALLLATRRARAGLRVQAGVRVLFMGKEFMISSDREQILDLLVTTFEEAVRQNQELRRREEELSAAQAQLARYAHSLEARLESILQSVPDVLFSVAADGSEIRYVSPAVTRVFGCPPEEFTLEYWRNHIHPDDRENARLSFEPAALTGTAQASEYRFQRHPSDVRWILQHLVPAASGPARIDGIARDITDRKAVEEALRQSESELKEREATFHLLFANNPLPMWLYDRETLRFLEVNDRAMHHYGYTRDEFLAMRLTDIRPPEEVPRLLENLAQHRDLVDVSGTWRHRKKSGEIIEVAIVSHTMEFAGRDAALVVAEDVTERRKLEEQVRQSQKMEAVGRLAGGVAHDFNNLLTAIMAEADFSLDDLPAKSPARESVQQIKKSAERAAALTRQLLAFSRRQVVQPTVLSLNDLVANTEKMLRRLISEDVELVTRLAPDLGATMADHGQIEQVLMNLVVNARDAMPAGGTITLETSNRTLDAEYAGLHPGAEPGDYAVLSVSDTGTGIPPEIMAHIFEPFFTTKEKDKGTGLGLATCYGIVKQSRGYIGVYTEPGIGTTFRIYLPRIAGPAPALGPRADPQHAGGSETILLVEDSPPVRLVAVRVLRAMGYHVVEAEDGEDALRVLAGMDTVHLVMTDLVMPGMSGRELVERIKVLRPAAKVLFSSGYTDDMVTRENLIERGATFLPKPYTREALGAKVREVLDG